MHIDWIRVGLGSLTRKSLDSPAFRRQTDATGYRSGLKTVAATTFLESSSPGATG